MCSFYFPLRVMSSITDLTFEIECVWLCAMWDWELLITTFCWTVMCCHSVFTALHVMQTLYYDENSVCLSVRLSVTRVNCDKTVERYVQIYIPYQRTFSLVFSEEEWLVGGDPFYLKFWINLPRWSKITDFEPIITRRASAITPSEKSSINANRKPTTRFPMSLRLSWYVAPRSPKGVWNAKWSISVKNRTSLEESLLQSFFVWKLSAAKL